MTITPEELERLEILANNVDFLAPDWAHGNAASWKKAIATIRQQWAELKQLPLDYADSYTEGVKAGYREGYDDGYTDAEKGNEHYFEKEDSNG